jgi:hypothetical protein
MPIQPFTAEKREKCHQRGKQISLCCSFMFSTRKVPLLPDSFGIHFKSSFYTHIYTRRFNIMPIHPFNAEKREKCHQSGRKFCFAVSSSFHYEKLFFFPFFLTVASIHIYTLDDSILCLFIPSMLRNGSNATIAFMSSLHEADACLIHAGRALQLIFGPFCPILVL